MSTQHTPGHWKAHGLAIYATNEKRAFGGPIRDYLRPVCTMEVVEGGDSPDYVRQYQGGEHNVRLPGDAEAEANARLIASAPDLLAALKRLVGEHADLAEVDLDTEEREAIDQAREAIAKAEGDK